MEDNEEILKNKINIINEEIINNFKNQLKKIILNHDRGEKKIKNEEINETEKDKEKENWKEDLEPIFSKPENYAKYSTRIIKNSIISKTERKISEEKIQINSQRRKTRLLKRFLKKKIIEEKTNFEKNYNLKISISEKKRNLSEIEKEHLKKVEIREKEEKIKNLIKKKKRKEKNIFNKKRRRKKKSS